MDTTYPFTGVIYKDWLPGWHPDSVKDGDKYVPGSWDPVEANTDYDVGWYYAPISTLIWNHNYMCLKGLWGRTQIPYSRTPDVSDATNNLRRWRGDKKEGHYKGLILHYVPQE